ncbi:MAG TPA: Stk1 family PASTA domain-containing Ser/Thr kinase [Kineosporiaceae bacterium]
MNQSPRVLGNRYEVGDLLGRGGMAEVHLGRDTRLGRVVAIKLLRTDLARDPVFQARFRREAQSAAGLNHPAIVAVYDTGEETIAESGGSTVSLPYIVMEYVEGRTLRDELRGGQPMDVAPALEVTSGILSALDYSHRMGIVHRDIKPANVMRTANGDVKVMDFGIARALADVSATMTQTQAVIGTAQYLSPEQARGETVDARSDLYSAGCLLFELMTGRPPFVADSPVAIAYQHVREAPPPPSAFNPRIPETVDRIVLHALAKDREARYQTANDFRADLEAALAGRAVAASTVALTPAASTEYLPSPGATQAYGQPAPSGYPAPGAPPYPQGNGGYEPPYDPRRGPGQAYEQYPPPPPDPGSSRRGDRRAAADAASSRRLGFAIFAIAVLLVFAAAAYGVSYLVSQNSAANSLLLVPDVARETKANATRTLETAGFHVAYQNQQSDQVDADSVIRFSPSGSQPRGTTVTLVISTGTATVQVPPLSGKTIDQAKAALAAVSLQANDIVEPVDGKGLAKNLVVSTNPGPGTSVAKGTKVVLNVSNGKVTIPDERNKKVDDAVNDLHSKGITDITVVKVPTDQTPDMVIDQDPLPSDTAKTFTRITLTVAMAPTDNGQPGGTTTGQQTDQNTGQNPNGGQNGQGGNGNGGQNGNG